MVDLVNTYLYNVVVNMKKSKTQITPIANKQTDKFNWENIFNNDVVKTSINNLTVALKQSIENENKKLENQIELRKLDIEEQKLYLVSDKQEQKYTSWFDIRNKIYTFIILISAIAIVFFLTKYGILDKGEARTIIIIALSVCITSNIGLIKRLISNKKH